MLLDNNSRRLDLPKSTQSAGGALGLDGNRSTDVERQTPGRARPAAWLAAAIDRSLPLPVAQQLRGLVEYGIAVGLLQEGQRLPSVRDCAEAAGLSPMTVAAVWRDLRVAGLIATRPGAGAYVARLAGDSAARIDVMRRLHGRVDALLAEAAALGLDAGEVAKAVAARAAAPAAWRPLTVLMVGVFEAATRRYAEHLAALLPEGVRVAAATIDALRAGAAAPAADVVVTLPHRRAEVAALVAPAPALGVTLLPSEETRARLARIDPGARLVMVSLYGDFAPIMRAGARRYAPDVTRAAICLLDDPAAAALLAQADVVVYATGADAVTARLRPGCEAFEFRHAPNPRSVRETLLPLIDSLRLAPQKEPAA